MDFTEFLGTLDPKTARAIKTATETKTEKLPLASERLTTALNGGVGKGRITLLYGNTSSGKTAMLLQSIGMWQRMGKVCAFVDAEATYDKDWAESLGVNNEELILVQKRSFGRITDAITPLLEAGIDAIVIDSISMALPEGFVDKDGGVADYNNMKQLGAHAKACSTMCNSIHYSNESTAVVLISQTTTEIGQTYTKQVPHGGKKTQFASSQIIKLTSSNTDAKQIKGEVRIGDMLLMEPIGRKVEAVVEKNKLGPQSRSCEYDFYYAGDHVGVDSVGEVVDDAVKYRIVEKAGAWLKFDGQQWQGRDAIVKYARESQEFVEILKKHTAAALNGGVVDE